MDFANFEKLTNFKSNKIEPFNDNFLKTKTEKKIKKNHHQNTN